MMGYNPGAFIQGIQAGEQINDMRQNRQMKQEQLKTQKQQLQMQQRTAEAQNFEFDLLKKRLDEKEAKDAKKHAASMRVIRDQASNDYAHSIKPDTFVSTGEFGGDIKILQDWSQQLSPDKPVPTVPNPNDSEQRKQMRQLLLNQDEELAQLSSQELENLINVNLMSGEYIATADGKIVDVPTMTAAFGTKYKPDAEKRWVDFMQAKNDLGLAAKGKLGSDSGEGLATRISKLTKNIGNKSLSAEERDEANVQLQSLLKEAKIDKSFAQSYAYSAANSEYVKSVKDGAPLSESAIKLNMQMEEMGGKLLKPSDNLYKKTTGEMATYLQVNDLMKEMSSLKPEEMSAGVSDEFGRRIATVASDEKFASLTPEQQIKALTRGKFTTKAGTIFAKFVKNISGSAVADQEFARLAKLFFGGDEDKVNVQTLMNSMSSFADASKTGIVKEAKTNASTYPGQMGNILQQVNNTESYTKQPKDIVEQFGSGAKNLGDLKQDVVASAVSETGGVIKDAAVGAWTSLFSSKPELKSEIDTLSRKVGAMGFEKFNAARKQAGKPEVDPETYLKFLQSKAK